MKHAPQPTAMSHSSLSRSLGSKLRNVLSFSLCLSLGSGMLAGWGIHSASAQTTDPEDDKIPRFVCEPDENGQYTVMYEPKSRPGESYAWATPGEMGGGWTEDRRCAEIARRLESYRPDGLLELRTSVENGYDIVCATTEGDSTCRIVFTVPQGQDPQLTRDRVFENIAMANSGEETQSVSTFRDQDGSDILGQIGEALGLGLPSLGRDRGRSSDSLYLRPFLAPEDGGTGLFLQGNADTPGRRLNPDDFR